MTVVSVARDRIAESYRYLLSHEDDDMTITARAVRSAAIMDPLQLRQRHHWIQKKKMFQKTASLKKEEKDLIAHVKDRDLLTGVCRTIEDIYSNPYNSYEEIEPMIHRLYEHVRTVKKEVAVTRNRTSSPCFCIEIMIPRTMQSIEDKRASIASMMEALDFQDDATFFAYSKTIGNGNYIDVIVIPRRYWKTERPSTIARSRSRYRSSTTGRLCRKDDPNAVLCHTEEKTMYTWFSQTTDFMDVGQITFKKKMDGAKRQLDALYDLLGYDDKDIILGRYTVHSSLCTAFNKKELYICNDKFRKIEERIKDDYKKLKETGHELLSFMDLVITLRKFQTDSVVYEKDRYSPRRNTYLNLKSSAVMVRQQIRSIETCMLGLVVRFEASCGLL